MSFISIVMNMDYPIEGKIEILEYTADEYWLQNKNLQYLELKDAINNLKNLLTSK